MSATSESHRSDLTGNQSQLSKQDQDDIAAIDCAIDRMRTLTHTDPYIITIPQDVEPRYHHSYMYQTEQWLHHTPFDPREHENTQYQTFIFREPGTDMYRLHDTAPDRGRADGEGKGMKSGAATGPNTPSNSQTNAPKKTMSLSAYKKKQTGATPDHASSKEQEQQAAKQPAVKGPIERIKADEEVLAAVKIEEDLLPAEEKKDDKKDLKRKRGDSVTEDKKNTEDKKTMVNVEADGDGPRKIRRTSSPSPVRKGTLIKVEQTNVQPDRSTHPTKKSPPQRSQPSKEATPEPSTLPPLLSPQLPAAEASELPAILSPVESPKDSPQFPPLLSPTLPTNIIATLEARAHYHSISKSSDAPNSRAASKDPDTRHLTPPPKHIPRNGFRANSSSPAVRSDAEDHVRAVTSAPRSSLLHEDTTEESEEIAVTKRTDAKKQRRQSSSKEPSRIVTLKFSKARREAVKSLLKMRPSPSTATDEVTEDSHAVVEKETRRASLASDARQRGRRDANAKGVAQKVGPGTATNGTHKSVDAKDARAGDRKRVRPNSSPDSDETPAKRKKSGSQQHESKRAPSTPAATSGPGLDLLSPPNPQRPPSQTTPSAVRRKDMLSASMKREQSNDSRNNTNTPPAMSQNSPPVNGTSTSQPVNGALKQAPSTKTPKQEAWESEQNRLQALGRDLKHSASRHSEAAENLTATSPNDAASITREQKRAAIAALESFLAYVLAFTASDQSALSADPRLPPSSRPWRTLQGFFGFVKNLCKPFPALYGLACHLGVAFLARILDIAADIKNSNLPPPEMLLETYSILRRAAAEADAKLDGEALRNAFPRTWEGRAVGGSMPTTTTTTTEMLDISHGFAGPYKLPFGVHTTPLRAARAGYAMLEEWIARESEGGEEKSKEKGKGKGALYEMQLKL